MENTLQSLPPGARVLIIRLRSLGDCVLTTPALEILKKTRPDLKLGVAVEPPFARVFEGNPDIDELVRPAPAAVARWRARLCLNLHGGPRSAWLTALSLAPIRAGFAHFRRPWLYNVRIPTAQQILGVGRKVHTAEHAAAAIFYLGAPRQEIPRAKVFAKGDRPGGLSYVVIHPLASKPEKTWPAAGFLAVARRLRREWEMEAVFIAGPGEDLSAFSEFRCLAGAPLAEVKTLLAGASLFIGNDSGPAHLAAAFGLPVLVIFGASDPVIWGPWRTPAEVIVARHGIGSVAESEVFGALQRLKVAA